MVLVYLGDGSRRIAPTIKQIGMTYRYIGAKALPRTMQEICAHPQMSRCHGQPFLYFTIDEKRHLQTAADAFVKAGIELPLMAVQNADNSTWTLKELLQAVRRMDEIRRIRNELMDIVSHVDRRRLAADPAYLHRMALVYAVLDSAPDLTTLKICLQEARRLTVLAQSRQDDIIDACENKNI
ncbi:DUF3783 domain-containing protein [Catenisphaera adipataccumulans]|jgi:hypothetical protein|uniref:Uncharacterized protein n=1 Tax=Catenisphaera adipataccumulans TaxID=700500 RepID=A0A7W8CX06_9FIRM|nr:DUF3783 domain-containing protein [Catenisphaera adipataccumulans]MBB5182013.1 hypothetical protein [Catenisphaera adipataccumulans]